MPKLPKPIAPLASSLLAALFSVSAAAADAGQTLETPPSPLPTVAADGATSKQIEKDLQSLNWEQFKSVVKAVPKLKADVDAFGPLGWQYVQLNYQTYGWKKNIDKLDDAQKKQLIGLITKARDEGGSKAVN